MVTYMNFYVLLLIVLFSLMVVIAGYALIQYRQLSGYMLKIAIVLCVLVGTGTAQDDLEHISDGPEEITLVDEKPIIQAGAMKEANKVLDGWAEECAVQAKFLLFLNDSNDGVPMNNSVNLSDSRIIVL